MRIPRNALILTALATAVAATLASAMDPLPRTPPIPADNPQTLAKVELGKALFFDPRLSKSGTVSCNSCHNVMEAGDDDRPNSVGVGGQTGDRSAPTVWNAAFLSAQFWDGRAATLEDQAKGPITNPIEMGMANHDVAVARLRVIPGYVERFAAVFGGEQPVTIDHVAKAIAAYERTLLTPNSAFDRYAHGQKGALSPAALRGKALAEEVGCVACHSGPVFAGPLTEPGAPFLQKFPAYTGNEYVAKYHLADDPGRFKVTQNEDDRGFWRVAMWRNVALTAPYFHNGAVPTLHEAVKVMGKAQLDRELTDAQAGDLVAFLESLSGTFPAQTMPRLPETPGRTLIE
jgi:cytochrome c peroxidase